MVVDAESRVEMSGLGHFGYQPANTPATGTLGKSFKWLIGVFVASVVGTALVPARWANWLVAQQPTEPVLLYRTLHSFLSLRFDLSLLLAMSWQFWLMYRVEKSVERSPNFSTLVTTPGYLGILTGPVITVVYGHNPIPPEEATAGVLDVIWRSAAILGREGHLLLVPFTCTPWALGGLALSLAGALTVRIGKIGSPNSVVPLGRPRFVTGGAVGLDRTARR